MHATATADDLPLPGALDSFDPHSGSRLERLVFNHRRAVIVLCAVITVLLGFLAATRLTLNASFERMLPVSHPYIKNYLDNRNELRGLGNSLRIVVENPNGDIYDPKYLETLRKINDELVLTPGVDRAWVKSLWSPAVRWTEVTEEGFRGGPVMPDNYDGSAAVTEQLRGNIARSGLVGSLVGNNYQSSMIVVPLLDKDPKTGQRIDYRTLSQSIESIRDKYEVASDGKTPAVRMHVIGFAKLVGDLIEGLFRVALYFGFAAVVAAAIIYYYTRCVRSTSLVLACSLVAVLWQLGLVAAFGFEIDPYSILVPFLVFAIGVSHGAQKMNGIMQDIGKGAHKLVAARYTFRRLFLAGVTALLADAVGFAVLMMIDIPVIQDLALTASIGVAVLILTNLILLPVLLSYIGVSPAAAARSLRADSDENYGRGVNKLWVLLERFTERRWATGAVIGARAAAAVRRGHQLQPEDRRPRRRRAGAARRLALQPRQRLHHGQLLAVQRHLRGDRQDREGRLPEVRDPGRGRPPELGAAAGAGRADHGVADQCGAPDHRRQQRRQPEVADDRAQPGRAELRRAAGQRQQPRPVQHRMFGDAGDRLPGRPPRRDAGPRGAGQRRIRRRAQHARAPVPARRRFAPASTPPPTSSCARPGRRCCCWCMRRWRCCASSPSAAGARWWWRWCRWS